MHCSGSVIGPDQGAHRGSLRRRLQPRQLPGDHRPPERCANLELGQVIGVTSGRVHPDFEQTGLHDVAVLNLAQPTSVTPVPLATPEQNAATTPVGAQLRVAGYGATNPFGIHLSGFLKATIEQSRTDSRCLKAYTRDLFAPESMICALGAKQKKPGRFKIHTSACSGDSGGPLVADTPTGPVEVGHRLLRRRALRLARGADGLLAGRRRAWTSSTRHVALPRSRLGEAVYDSSTGG